MKVEDVITRLLNNEYKIKAYRDKKIYRRLVNNEKITAIGMSAKNGSQCLVLHLMSIPTLRILNGSILVELQIRSDLPPKDSSHELDS
jgi:hypothetical protein